MTLFEKVTFMPQKEPHFDGKVGRDNEFVNSLFFSFVKKKRNESDNEKRQLHYTYSWKQLSLRARWNASPQKKRAPDVFHYGVLSHLQLRKRNHQVWKKTQSRGQRRKKCDGQNGKVLPQPSGIFYEHRLFLGCFFFFMWLSACWYFGDSLSTQRGRRDSVGGMSARIKWCRAVQFWCQGWSGVIRIDPEKPLEVGTTESNLKNICTSTPQVTCPYNRKKES